MAEAEPFELPDLGGQPSMRVQVTRALRAALVAGQMEPGVTYSVPPLAERFRVSATPVREAMLDLAKEGLVKPMRNKGFRVVEFSDHDLDELTELRLLIEPPSVRRVVDVITPDDLSRLRKVAAQISQFAADGQLINYVEADRLFHVTMLSLLGNQRLADTVEGLRAHTRLLGLAKLANEGNLLSSAGEHLELLDALESADGAAAERLMHRHVSHTRGIWAKGNSAEPAASGTEV